MPAKCPGEDTDPAQVAPLETSLPRRSRRRSSKPSSSLPHADSADVKPAASTALAAQDDHSMDEASDAESDSSVLSTSSEEPSSESDDSEEESSDAGADEQDEEITSLPLPPDAATRRQLYAQQAPPQSSLSERLRTFLPQLAAANDELERDRLAGKLAKHSIEDVGENEENYIEMSLGLGVLEQKDPNKMDGDTESSDGSGDEMEVDGAKTDENKSREKDVLGKLMGQKRTRVDAGIQEIPDE